MLQLCCSTAMVSVWLILLQSAIGRSPISSRAALLLFFAMMVPWLMSPALALQGTWSPGYREGFTTLMRWSIFPVVSLFLIACLRQLWQEWRAGRLDVSALANPRISGFLVSAALTLLGFGLGAAIRGSNTMIPAHYHASIGGVTAAGLVTMNIDAGGAKTTSVLDIYSTLSKWLVNHITQIDTKLNECTVGA